MPLKFPNEILSTKFYLNEMSLGVKIISAPKLDKVYDNYGNEREQFSEIKT